MANDNRKRKASFSSQGTVVQRWFGGEQLDHSAGAVRMDFMNSGRAPLLMNHDTRNQIGVVDSASIDADKVGRSVLRFGRTATAADSLTNVDDGILTNTSVGYRVHEMKLLESRDDGDTYLVTDWEPYEVSLVAVPADQQVGVGRTSDAPGPAKDSAPEPPAATTESTEARQVRASSDSKTPAAKAATTGDVKMAEKDPAAGNAEQNLTAVQAETERREAIIALCAANKIDSRTEAQWIADGTRITGKDGVSAQILAVIEERGKARPTASSDLGLSRSETQRYSLFRAIRALHFGARNPKFVEDAGFEIECSRAIAKQTGRGESSSILVPGEILQRPVGQAAAERAMATTPGSKGGYAVNITNMGFIDILRNRSVAMRMGARQLSGLNGNVTFARQTGKPSVTWQAGEGSSTTAADQTLGQLSMTPKTCIAITDVSEQLLRQMSPSAEAFVMADLAADVAIDGVDNAVINGAGGAQPLGIKNTTGITSGQDAASATYAKVLAFVSTAGSNNAIRGNPGWVTNTAGAARLMQVQRFTSTDTPLWTGNMLDGQCVGFNAMSSEQIGSGGLIFGSWDEVLIGDWGVLELSTDNGGTRFNQAQVGVRALWMVDVLVRYPQAFVSSVNLS